MSALASYSLGLDTGGTFTDAALLDATGRVIATAKAPTTRHDLAEGIAGAVEAVLAEAGIDPGSIGLIGLSTTLATNAIVEGQGGAVGLVMIGFEPAQLARPDLAKALGADPVALIGGGHSVFGDEAAPLDLDALDCFLDDTASRVEAYAVAGLFAVRNPDHERRALARILERTGKPVSASHHLANALDGPRRALTALINARLVPLVSDLVARTRHWLALRGITAPLMIVRGNGALMSAAEAMARPVETVLSGPAASAVGAAFLTGAADAIIADIGGTTTDIGIMAGGLPAIDPRGARVGGHETMVEAIRMATIGLGGDSEVAIDDEAPVEDCFRLGPRRLMPVAALAAETPDLVHQSLDLQLLRPLPGPWDGRFARLVRPAAPEAFPEAEREMIAALREGPKPLESICRSQMAHGTLQRLVSRGLVLIVGLTPTDCAHILGRHARWDAEASRKAAQLFLRRRNRFGQLHAPDARALAGRVLDTLVERSAAFLLDTAAEADGFAAPISALEPVRRALLARKAETHGNLAADAKPAPGAPLVRLGIGLARPIIALGAGAPLHYPAIAARLGGEAIVPEHAGVANAIGAVVGQVRKEARVLLTQPERGRFRIHLPEGPRDAQDYTTALEAASEAARALALAALAESGAAEGETRLDIRETSAEIGGETVLVEAETRALAIGRPAMHGAAIRTGGAAGGAP